MSENKGAKTEQSNGGEGLPAPDCYAGRIMWYADPEEVKVVFVKHISGAMNVEGCKPHQTCYVCEVINSGITCFRQAINLKLFETRSDYDLMIEAKRKSKIRKHLGAVRRMMKDSA